VAVGLLTLTMPAVASLARPGAFNVTANTTNDYTPSYSPSGQRIAYQGYDGRDKEIYTVGVGGGGR
jgi:Tol biopolymer transport system component